MCHACRVKFWAWKPDYEGLTCALRGHVTPADSVRELRPGDRALGFEGDDGTRFARCVRCDVWVRLDPESPTVAGASEQHLPPLDDLELPARGKVLRDAILIRVIAVIRGFHSVAFTVLAIGLALLMTDLARLKELGDSIRRVMDSAVEHTGQQASRSFVTDTLNDIDALRPHALKVLFATAVAYAVLEGVEAVGLWRQKRWAEYLTVVATAGFLPFEISALIDKVTPIRIGALVVNLAILGWLVWSKRLFGLHGGRRALDEAKSADARRHLDELAPP